MTDQPGRILKVGGSLLDLPDLPERLQAWLARQGPARNVLVAGGGPLVDTLRKMNGMRPIADEISHWLAIDLMDVAARVLAAWMPGIPLISRIFSTTEATSRCLTERPGGPCALHIAWQSLDAQTVILAPGIMLRDVEPNSPGVKLPKSWAVTSDSIAARLAVLMGFPELVLFKSVTAPSDRRDDAAWSQLGYVDRFFPRIAKSISTVRFENLRLYCHHQ
ncbi:MAG: hypothetical protein JW829_01320 [Pirellulales bacterium]|nr:hypothetical protein [Pirellulales bacterium]